MSKKIFTKKRKKILAITVAAIIAISTVGAFALGILQYDIEASKKSKLNVEHAYFNGETVNFRISNSGQLTAESAKFQYIRTNQTKNTCSNNTYVFNSSWTPMCLFTVVELSSEGRCQIDVPPMATGTSYNIKYPPNNELLDFRLNNPNATNCEIEEILQLHATDGNVNAYSDPFFINFKIT